MTWPFIDEIQLEQVRRRLWRGREMGRAAVMVGAGFSLQAQVIVPHPRPFPLGADISRALDAALNPPGSRAGAFAAAGPRLAAQYEVVFGRSALDQLLLDLIPDQQYVPGPLHQRLLALPWSDVFTTNYDTLLERALPRVHERKYDVLLNVSDIPGRQQPRIVKLHGSFPSHRPFIITEEDYRQYPVDFAPFVNTVQQSLIQDALCLLGFSGEDPNFLYWTGWVRDNLGESRPPIYLCGVLGLSDATRQLLTNRRILPVDLAPIVPHARFPDSQQRHAAALEWLISFLEAGKPANRLTWPAITPAWRPTFPSGLPEIRTADPPLEDAASPAKARLTVDQLRELSGRWRKTRLRYPGWEVAPFHGRQLLWHNTSLHVEQVVFALEAAPPVDRLHSLYELTWRIDTALVPLLQHWLPPMVATLEAINPDPSHIDMPMAVVRPDPLDDLDWNDLTRMWVECAFSVAREAREDADRGRFDLWMGRLSRIVTSRPDWHARWVHENCLFHMLHLDHDAVRTALADWPAAASPFWQVKRASILAEIGQIEAAERLAQEALNDLRARQVSVNDDIALLSQEGWTMTLLRSIRANRLILSDPAEEERDRWDTLATHRCNPRNDLELLSALVSRPVPPPKPKRETTRQFDPGASSTVYHLGSRIDKDAILAGFAFLRMLENGAVPLRCGLVATSPSEVSSAADWIQEWAPLWSLAVRLRTGQAKAIQGFFDRALVASLEQDRFDFLFTLAQGSLRQALARIASGQEVPTLTNSTLVSLFGELLSRLSVRANDAQLDSILTAAVDMYRMPAMRAFPFHEPLRHLFERAILAIHPHRLTERLPALLELPIPGVGGFEVGTVETWPEPFAVQGWPNMSLMSTVDLPSSLLSIEWLLYTVSTGHGDARRRATMRLLRLQRLGLLPSSIQTAFGEALWSKLDPTSGLPANTGLFPTTFLHLPAPQPSRVLELLRAYVSAGDFRRLIARSPTSGAARLDFFAGPDLYLHTLWDITRMPWPPRNISTFPSIEWTPEEAAVLLGKLTSWWNHHKEELSDSGHFDAADDIKEAAAALVTVLTNIVLPRLSKDDGPVRESALRLLAEMETSGLSVFSALPLTVRFGANIHEVAAKLRAALFSSMERAAAEAVQGITIWSLARNILPAPPDFLLDDLVHLVASRRQPALISALEGITSIAGNAGYWLTKDRLAVLALGLRQLADETSLSSPASMAARADHVSMAAEDRPRHRRASAVLAAALSTLPGVSTDPCSEVIELWRQIVRADPLPEVRRAWNA